MLIAFLFATLFSGSIGNVNAEGVAWIAKAEQKLYRWPSPGVLVKFDAKTDALNPAIAAMERELAKKPDPEGTKLVTALKQMVVHGTVDTGTGALTTEVDVPFETKDPQGKQALQKMKVLMGETMRGAFGGLPLHDLSLVPHGASVVGSESNGDAVVVTIVDRKPDQRTLLTLNRESLLPTKVDLPKNHLELAYTEVMPGKFAPAHLDVVAPNGTKSHADYAWQKIGDCVFPATIHLVRGDQTASVTFESVRVEPRGH
jgi:hypothetical protein